MLRVFLQAKLYPVRVTETELEYDGSLGLSRTLIEEAGLSPGQIVLVVNLANGERFETYLIEREEGVCSLNGGTARLGMIGDNLIVMAFVYLDPGETVTPRVVKVDPENVPTGQT